LLIIPQRAPVNIIHKQKMKNNYVNLHGYCTYGQDMHNFKQIDVINVIVENLQLFNPI